MERACYALITAIGYNYRLHHEHVHILYEQLLADVFNPVNSITTPCPEVGDISDVLSRSKLHLWETESKFHQYFYYANSLKENYELPKEDYSGDIEGISEEDWEQ